MNNKNVNRAFMHKCIPYENCYEEGGMIEIQKGVFTRDYRIIPPDEAAAGSYLPKKTRALMESILQKLSENFAYEFTIRNCYRDKAECLSEILLKYENDDAYADGINLYNRTLQENYEVGHNNAKMQADLILKRSAETPEKALEYFLEMEPMLQELFYALYGFKLQPLSLTDRLKLLYEIYHPEPAASKFGSKVDYDGNGFSVRSMERMKMTTKDVIMPDRYECTERTYLRVGNLYARTFFFSYIPKVFSENVLLDISAVSSRSIISVYGQSVDEALGFHVSARHVQNNTEVKNIPIRDTINDRKNHRMERQERSIREDENEYFYQAALDMFKGAKAKEQAVIQSAILITLFGDTLEEIERDTKLLLMSASKYACQIRCLDLQQNEGFQSVLPLCNIKVNVSRVFSLEQMAVMQPLRIHDIFEKTRTYYGLNAINDNLVLMDRRNYPIAMIAGINNSGKTVAVKREVANTLFSTRDDVILLVRHPKEYQGFAEKLHGQMINDLQPDIFEKDANYNLNQERHHLQEIFLEAYLSYKVGEQYQKGLSYNVKQMEEEAAILSRFADLEASLVYAKEHPLELPLYIKSLENLRFAYDKFSLNSRLAIVGFEDNAELLTRMDAIWNYAVQSKKRNRTVWIYVDAADGLAHTTSGNNYLISILERAEVLKVPVTLVIESAVHIVSNQKAMIEFDYLLDRIGCFKLLSLGPVERKVFIERLNISQQMIPYFVDRGPGEGILVTPSATIAFNDRFETAGDEFYKLFQ